MKQSRNILPAFMQGRCNYMVGRLTVQLLNIFSEIRLDHLNIMLTQKLIEMDLFGHHGFTFHDGTSLSGGAYAQNLVQGLLRVFRPDNTASVLREPGFKLREIFIQVFKSLPLDMLGYFSCRGNVRELHLSPLKSLV